MRTATVASIALVSCMACTALLGVEEAGLVPPAPDGACPPGFTTCDPAAPCQVELARDPSHCGTCANACAGAHATGICTEGTCTLACDPGYCDGDRRAENGCEAALSSDGEHCGACDRSCGGGRCSAGVCQPVLLGYFPGGVGGVAPSLDPRSVYVFVKQAGGGPVGGQADAGAVVELGADGHLTRITATPLQGDVAYLSPASSQIWRVGEELFFLGSDVGAATWRLEAKNLVTGASRCVATFPTRLGTATTPPDGRSVALDIHGGRVLVASRVPNQTQIRSYPLDGSCLDGPAAPVAIFPEQGVTSVLQVTPDHVFLITSSGFYLATDAGVRRVDTPLTPSFARAGDTVYGCYPGDARLRRLDDPAACGDSAPCGTPVTPSFQLGCEVIGTQARVFVRSGELYAVDPESGLAVALPLARSGAMRVSTTADGRAAFVAVDDGTVFFVRLP